MTELSASQKDKLMTDLKVVVNDAEELLKLTAGQVTEGTATLRARMQERLTEARQGLASLQADATERARAAGRAADDYVHENPWQAIGLGAAVGLLVGLLTSRR